MFLRDFILKDFWLKLFSVGLAILIWFTVTIAIRNENAQNVTLSNSPPRTFSLPVRMMSATADVRGFSANPKFVEVTVRGESNEAERLEDKDIHVWVDLTAADAARNFRQVVQVSAPAGIEVIRVIPADLEILVPAPRPLAH